MVRVTSPIMRSATICGEYGRNIAGATSAATAGVPSWTIRSAPERIIGNQTAMMKIATGTKTRLPPVPGSLI